MSPDPVSIVAVSRNGFFFTRLLVEKIREHTTDRAFEIIIVDRDSSDGSVEWLRRQRDVRLLRFKQSSVGGHRHGEAAEYGVQRARHSRIVLLDFDAHPTEAGWLGKSADRLTFYDRLAGAAFVDKHRGNPYGWYAHPHFMTFFKQDLGKLIVLRKIRGEDTDTGEEATIRVLDAGLNVIGLPLEFCARFDVGNPSVPTISGGVFHAWYSARLEHHEAEVIRETDGKVTRANYLDPLKARLRQAYNLAY